MTLPALPDGTYMNWRGRIRRAYETVDPPGTVMLKLDPGEPAPEGYSRDQRNDRLIYIPESELTELFSLDTECRWRGRTWPVTGWTADGRVTIEIFGIPPEQAEAWGLTPSLERAHFTTTLPISEVTDLRQVRQDLLT